MITGLLSRCVPFNAVALFLFTENANVNAESADMNAESADESAESDEVNTESANVTAENGDVNAESDDTMCLRTSFVPISLPI